MDWPTWQNWLQDWFEKLGREYGVDPLVLLGIYLGSAPFLAVAIARLIRALQQKRSIGLPATVFVLATVSPYLYIAAVGRNIPWWAYLLLLGSISSGLYTSLGTIRSKVAGRSK